MIKKLLLLLLFIIGICPMVHGEPINMHKIMMIESGGNPNLIEKWGGIGLYQVTPGTLKEFNNHKGVDWSDSDLLNPSKNTIVANWYLTKRIPQMLRHYHKSVSTKNIIIAYNAGISYVVQNKKLPKTTIEYLKKYGV